MLRFVYRWLLRLHPARFRVRFAEEMLAIFDDAAIRSRRRAAGRPYCAYTKHDKARRSAPNRDGSERS
ncbi:MAG: hypothetical protein WBQ68_17165 [Terriglobales bacterium]